MNDALGDALQKLSASRDRKSVSGETPMTTEQRMPSKAFPLQLRFIEPAHSSSPETPLFAANDRTSEPGTGIEAGPAIRGLAIHRPADSTVPMHDNAATAEVAAEVAAAPQLAMEQIPAETPSDAAPAVESAMVTTVVPRAAQAQPGVQPVKPLQPVQFVLNHRRQVAAAVVIICMMALYMDDQTSISRQASMSEETSLSEGEFEETLLSEFDAAQTEPLREPAEPVDESGAARPDLTIPIASPSDGSLHAFHGESAHRTVGGTTGLQATPGNSAADTGETAGEAAGSVRFTGRIAPLN